MFQPRQALLPGYDRRTRFCAIAHLFLATFTLAPSFASEPPEPAVVQFFETDVRPLLAKHCYECHSGRAKKLKGELRVDSLPHLLRGGETGPALVPGAPDSSPLIQAVRYEGGLEMPPRARLSEDDIATLEKWVRLGAPFPNGATDDAPQAPREPFSIGDAEKNYWAYRPVSRPAPPELTAEYWPAQQRSAWNTHPIDRLVGERLVAVGLKPAARANDRTLVRRVYFDLVGLPPSAEQIDAYCNDQAGDKYQQLVDRLLESPRYGERWGRYWLDVVRYAQSNGYERDGEKPMAWRYRDYVIDAFNDDLPYDRFVLEQLAGDELPDATASSVVATAFFRLGVWDDEPDDKRAAEFDALDDMLSTIGQVFLGQTIGCARCHDHMFDPISQRDYYELLSSIRNVKYYDNPKPDFSSATYAPLAAPSEVQAFLRKRDATIASLTNERNAAEAENERRRLDEALKHAREDTGPVDTWTLAVQEHGTTPKPTHLLVRGDASTPSDRVVPRILAVLGNDTLSPPDTTPSHSCGLRLQLAHWIASTDNPLTSRVIVNRIWQYHFGRGIVATPNDFGQAGLGPTHPRLLDWLAAELTDNSWSLKHMHRRIMNSETYRMSSANEDPNAAAADPSSRWLWRRQMRRLDAEAIRDAMLVVSNELNTKMYGRGFFPDLSGEVVAGQSRPGHDWGVSPAHEQLRRSVYSFTKRGVRDPLLESFDYVNTTSPLGARPVTTVAPQALVLLNGRFVRRRASVIADQVLSKTTDSTQAYIERLYRATLSRSPTRDESRIAADFVAARTHQEEALSEVITIRPDVPTALNDAYRKQLQPQRYFLPLVGNWQPFRGRWIGGYESIDALDDDRVPFVLWQGVAVTNGQLRGKIMLHNATKFASLLIDGSAKGDEFRGVEIRLDPRNQTITSIAHGKQLERGPTHQAYLPTQRWHDFTLNLEPALATLTLNESTDQAQTATFARNASEESAKLGVAVSRGAVSFDKLSYSDGNTDHSVARRDKSLPSAFERAFRELCVVILNSNEFVYID